MTEDELINMIAESMTNAQAHADTGEPLPARQYARRIVADLAERRLMVVSADAAEQGASAIEYSAHLAGGMAPEDAEALAELRPTKSA